MQLSVIVLSVLLLIIFDFSKGLEYGRQQQRYNPNADFLLHEGGIHPNEAKKDSQGTRTSTTPAPIQQNVNQNNGNGDYLAQFPQLKPLATVKPSTTTYINQNSGKRDYVAQFPQLPSPVTPKSPTTQAVWSTQSTKSPGGKRDYVNPQFPALKPVLVTNQPANGKVKDLINFFDTKPKDQKTPQNVPSYSSTLQGSTNKNVPGSSTKALSSQTTPKPASAPTKPLSYSNAVSGSKAPVAQTTLTTPRITTKAPTNTPSLRPSSPVLPSSIANRNKNNQANNNAPTDAELQTLAEELLRKDVNNAAKYVTVNYQEKTTSQSKDDKAPRALLVVSSEAWNIPTIQKLLPLLDNYERDTSVNEYVTPQERKEENDFMDAIMSTSVIRHLMNFLKDKGYVSPDPQKQRDFLKQLWFSLYSRGKGKISSSGFEHVFVSEVRNGGILGLHNWIYFSKEEAANRVNYLGYLKYVNLGDKGAVLKFHFNQQGNDKPVSSIFIGTSPELEVALYTLCFVTRADNDCKLKLANNDIDIVTHTFRYRSKNLIGSAYPEIPSNYNY